MVDDGIPMCGIYGIVFLRDGVSPGPRLLDPAAVVQTVSLHEAGREDHTDHFFSPVNMEVPARIYLDKWAPVGVTSGLTRGAAA